MGLTAAATRRRPIRRLRVVIPVLNEAENIGPLVRELSETLLDFDLSILVIDDGSTDETLKELQALRATGLPVDYASLSRNFGKEAALIAGLTLCPDDFDALVTMDGDGQHPPAIIADMVTAAERADTDLVIGVRTDCNYQSILGRSMRRAFYAAFNALSQTKLPYGMGDFNLYRPGAVEAVRSLQEYDLFLRGLVAWIGFNPVFVEHEARVRAGRITRWPFGKLVKLTADGLVSFTDWPLRVWSLIGAALAMVSFLYLAVTLVQSLLFGDPVRGYPSLIMAILGLGGLQLLSIGILGSYLGRTYMEAKRRPRYFIRDSSLQTDASDEVSRASTAQ